MSDPTALGRGVRVVLEIEGERFDATVYGSARRRLVVRQAGERVELVAERRLADGPWARRAQVRHVVGELAVDSGSIEEARLEQVARLISTHVLLGWDTGGEAWSP